MEVKTTKNKITLTHKLKRGEVYKISKGSSIQSLTIYKTPQEVVGFSNICKDNTAILVLDYDNVEESVVFEDYFFIQEKFHLPQGYMFKTDKGYHVICLRKFLSSEIYEIMRNTRIDENYRSMPLRNPFRAYVLRLSAKKKGKNLKFIRMIGFNNNNDYPCSKAHLELISKLYPQIKHPIYTFLDKNHEIKLNLYETK